MGLVTISGSYGAGGSRIAPAVAERLGVPFLGRPPLPEDAETSEAPTGLLTRMASLALSWGTMGGMTLLDLLPDQAQREELEREIRDLARSGAGVVLGRAGVVVLGDDPRVLHVLLDGPVERRVEQAMAIEGIDRVTAERRLDRVDRFRRAYLHDLYGFDLREPGVCQLTLDSTALPLDTCVELIVVAAQKSGAAGRPT